MGFRFPAEMVLALHWQEPGRSPPGSGRGETNQGRQPAMQRSLIQDPGSREKRMAGNYCGGREGG
jgi:hypothetical protein